MADKDWLNIDDNRGANHVNTNGGINEIELDYGINQVENNSGAEHQKAAFCSRRKIILGIAGLVLAVGTGIVLYFTVLSGSKQLGSSSNSAQVGVHSNGKHTLDENSHGSNRIPSPTPVGTSYGSKATTSPGPTASNAHQIADIIDNIARNGGDEFQDANSYQSRAKKWVLTQDFPVNDGSSLTMEQQASQLYVLACIYFATYSVKSQWTDIHYAADVVLPGWYTSRGWLGSAEDVCNWYGLTCNAEGRISKIELSSNGLTGAFPSEVALLHESLKTIDLYDNMLHNAGEEGNSFLGELTNLENLYFAKTFFEYDGVPPALGKLTALKELDFSDTMYFGKLDGAAFGTLSNLVYLSMKGNAYNSSLPSELVQLPELLYFYADFSFLEGGLDFIASMPKIRELWIADNPGLKGTLSTQISNVQTLASLSATNCGISGTIPTELGMMMNMVQLWLDSNDLTGQIPSELGNLVAMNSLYLEGNKLEGEMPTTVCGRRRPFGRLEELGADCDGAITCSEECCTCCGDECKL